MWQKSGKRIQLQPRDHIPTINLRIPFWFKDDQERICIKKLHTALDFRGIDRIYLRICLRIGDFNHRGR